MPPALHGEKRFQFGGHEKQRFHARSLANSRCCSTSPEVGGGDQWRRADSKASDSCSIACAVSVRRIASARNASTTGPTACQFRTHCRSRCPCWVSIRVLYRKSILPSNANSRAGRCDYVLWFPVGRASPHDLFRRARTLGVPQTLRFVFGGPFALPREIPHLPIRATKVGRTRAGSRTVERPASLAERARQAAILPDAPLRGASL